MAESFAELLRRFRVAASLTQEQLAERAGVSADAVAALEQGRRRSPRLSTVGELADALGLDPTERSQLARSAGPRQAPGRPDERRDGPGAAVPARPLPAPLTPLVGRQAELGLLLHEITTQRLVTLTGPGGAGKTRLALALAGGAADKFEGGTWWAGLDGVADGAEVPRAVLATLGSTENPGRGADDQVLAALPTTPVLLVLDNCEQVVEAVAALVAKLLTVPTVSVLATSREPVGIPGEVVRPVAGLAVPSGDLVGEPEALAAVASVELFTDRAGRADPGFRLSVETAPAVAAICRRLEGLPLALELNAVRVRSMPVAALAEELERRIALGAGAARGVPERHTTLWSCIDWSYQLLDEAEQRVFRCLALAFAPLPVTAVTAVAAAVASPMATDEAAQIVDSLVAKSMVVAPARTAPGPDPAFRLLDSLRAYAWERAEEAGELDAMRDAHAEHMLTWLEHRRADEPTDEAMGHIAAAYPNIRAALTWSIERRSVRSADLVFALAGSWHFHSRLQDARVLGDGALGTVEHDTRRWAAAVGALSLARLLGGDLDFVTTTVPQSTAAARAHGDRRTEGWSLYVRSLLAPFDQADLHAVYDIGRALDRPSLAAVAAVAAAIGGVDGPGTHWLGRIEDLRPRLGSRTMLAMCDTARIDALTEAGRFAPALALALPIAPDPAVMPTTADGAWGRIACLAFLQDDAELAALADEIADVVDQRWPTGGHRWWGSLPGLRLALVRRERFELGTTEFWTTRLGMQPSLVRTFCRAHLDQGRVLAPEAMAQQVGAPEAGSLMGASFAAVRAAQLASADPDAAASLWREVLGVASEQGWRVLACDGLEGLGALLCARGEVATGAVLLDAGAELRRRIGYRFRFAHEDAALAAARRAVAGAGGDGGVDPGRSPLPWRRAVALAVGSDGAAGAERHGGGAA
ncbi:MAG TPA: helix-turn-helix domain-containing protein [Acidimicrobiales bacterium]|nr:helix-turn-helix domain-containing protein [Acidimicrobiales bacterium]